MTTCAALNSSLDLRKWITTHCTHVVNDTIYYYNFNQTNVQMFLDASKEIDRFGYCKLFKTYCIDFSACLL